MKKTTLLVIGILFTLVISSSAALKTNAIVQCEDTPGIVIETSEPPYLLIETPIDTARQFTILHPDNITEITDFVPAPLTPRFMNCTVNFTVVFPMTTNVHTDKGTYDISEIVTYGIENTLNYNIGGISVSIQRMVTCNWETLFTYYTLLLLEPGETYESTWDQKGEYGRQVETGMYRIMVNYGYQGGHDTGYAYFSITNTYCVVPPSGDFPVNVTIMNDTGTYPVVIPPGFPWVTPLQVYYLE